MAGSRRGSISGWVGDIPIVNTAYSGELSDMSTRDLERRRAELVAEDPDDEECDEAFMNRQEETSAIIREIEKRVKE